MEVVVVIFLMALGLSMAMGFNFAQQKSTRLRSAGRDLYAFLASSRSQAVLSGKSNVCWYAPAKDMLFSDLRNKTLSLPEGVSILRPGELGLDTTEETPTSSGVQIFGLDDEEGLPHEERPVSLVVFYADGSAEAGTIWLTSGDRVLAVEMDPVLGEPKIASKLIPRSELPLP